MTRCRRPCIECGCDGSEQKQIAHHNNLESDDDDQRGSQAVVHEVEHHLHSTCRVHLSFYFRTFSDWLVNLPRSGPPDTSVVRSFDCGKHLVGSIFRKWVERLFFRPFEKNLRLNYLLHLISGRIADVYAPADDQLSGRNQEYSDDTSKNSNKRRWPVRRLQADREVRS